ncbi:MAG: glutamate mutase L, partial [bacterium]
APIMPTPGAVGLIMKMVADLEGIEIVGVDIGGATTDVFSVFKGIFNRTVSANLGMSYSISNVFTEAGLENIMRWVPFDIDSRELRNRIKNKMIRPTTIPQTLEELIIEQAIAREAIRLAFIQHKAFATTLKGVQRVKTVAEAFEQEATLTLVNMLSLNMIIGSGGILSHAPRRNQAAMMLLDAFQPEGITRLAVDSIFMMPQLGVLSTIHPKAAKEVFDKDCLIHLGTSIVPVGLEKEGKEILKYTINFEDGRSEKGILKFGEMRVYELGVGNKATVTLEPARGFDIGQGKGKKIENEKVYGGVVGIIFDGRGRPLKLPEDKGLRISKLKEWFRIMNLYPESSLL